jgi:hypothetical protein
MPYADPIKNRECQRRWQREHPENFQRWYRKHKKLHRARCDKWKKKNIARYQAWRKKHRAKKEVKQREVGYRLKTLYGITLEQRAAMLKKQRGKCPICKRKFSKKLLPHVDHNHATGKVRGLLCSTDNICLAGIDKDRRGGIKALTYLEKRRA